VHYVDYSFLKRKIREYARRRSSLKALYRNGGDVCVTKADLRLLGCADDTAVTKPTGVALRRKAEDRGEDEQGGYFQYTDSDEHAHVKMKDALSYLSRTERLEFCGLLDREITKAATFYGTQLVFLAKSITHLDNASTAPSHGDVPTTANVGVSTQSRIAKVGEVGNEILEAFAFVVVNVITLRQILIRYDAFVRTQDGLPLSQWYLRVHSGKSREEDHIQSLFHLDALNLQERSFLEKAQLMKLTDSNNTSGVEPPVTGSDTYLSDHTKQFSSFSKLLVQTLQSVERAASGDIVWRDRIVSSLRHYFLIGSQTKGLSMEPAFLLMRGRHLKEEMKAIATWRETRSLTPDMVGEEAENTSIDPENVVPLILNLLSCFLYLMNNYIIEPSSAYYANALGSNDALSGIMVGASPWFALMSCVGYSFWTNYSYRKPIIFAALLMMVGNFMYGAAYAWGRSMPICLIGRAITGLGAPRVINRRYIADSTPFSLRTAASAAFAMATAVGAAMGPGMAILLDMIEFEFYLPLLGKHYFNGMTGPGYFMCLCWGIYLFCALIWLKEPSRSGIEELKRREEAEVATSEIEAGNSASQRALMESLGDYNHSCSNDTEASFRQKSFEGIFNDNENDLGEDENGESKDGSGYFECFKHLNHATLICMSLIFMKRISLENVVGSTSIVTKNRYGWSIKNVGLLHLVNGIIVIPVSALAGWLSQFREDRYLAVLFLSITLFGMVFLIDLTDFVSTETEMYNEGHWLAVGPARYITGSIIAFSGIEACESFVASLMSKVVPSALAVGTFNSGLLETLVGTWGRAMADLIITTMALISLRQLLNLLVIPASLLVVISIALIRVNYEELAL